MSWRVLEKLEFFQDEAPHLFQVGKTPVCIWKQGVSYFAFDDRCPHRGGPLSEGKFENGHVHCPWHAAEFDVVSGSQLSGPPCSSLKKREVREQSGNLEIMEP